MKGRARLIASIGIAIVLATFMLYTALAGGDVQLKVLDARQLASARAAVAQGREQVELIGVAAGPVKGTAGGKMSFYVTDKSGAHRTLVRYSGSVPDAFKVGRSVVVKGNVVPTAADLAFRAVPGSLQTKCPSRFQSAKAEA